MKLSLQGEGWMMQVSMNQQLTCYEKARLFYTKCKAFTFSCISIKVTYRKLLRQSFAIFCLAVRSATLCICSKRLLNSVSFWKKACIFATNSLTINAAGVGRISCSNTVSQLPDHNPVKLKLTYDSTVPCQAASEVYSR